MKKAGQILILLLYACSLVLAEDIITQHDISKPRYELPPIVVPTDPKRDTFYVQQGMIMAIDLANRKIAISEDFLPLADSVLVVDVNGYEMSIYALTEQEYVRLWFSRIKNKFKVTRIYIVKPEIYEKESH